MKAREFYELQTHDSTCVVGIMDKDEIINLMDAFCDAEVDKMVSERDEIAIKALETINHAYYTEGESAEEQVIDLRSIALKALEEIDNLKTN